MAEKKDSLLPDIALPLIILGIFIVIGGGIIVGAVTYSKIFQATKMGIPSSLVKKGTLNRDCDKFSEKSKPYIDTINKYAAQYGVDPALVSGIIEQESGWNKDAVSPKKAVGLMQLIPDTAKGLGVENSLDADQNIMGGTKYISQLLARYNGDENKAIAAYNAGPGAVDAAGGIPNYEETKNYVINVDANWRKYKMCLEQMASGSNGAGEVPSNASANGAKVLEAAREYSGHEADCYKTAIAVYVKAGMNKKPVGYHNDQWDKIIADEPQPGYILDLDLDKNGTADHTVIFDHEEIINGQRVWRFWGADASHDWTYTDMDPSPGSNNMRVPWSPDTEGLPIHMWRPQ